MPDSALPSAARRRPARALRAVLLLLLAAPGPVAEAPAFARPPGWRQEAGAPAGLLQFGRDFAPGHAAILLSGPLPRQEGLEAALARVLADLPGATPPDRRGTGTTARGQALAFAQWDGSEGVLDAVVLDDVLLEGGARRVALLLRGRGLAPRRALLARDAFDAAVRAAPAARDAPPLLPPEPAGGLAGGLDGAYTGLRFEHRPNGEGETETLAQPWVLLFHPAGLFSRVVPGEAGGVPAHCRASPADCGTYALLGGGWLRGADRIRLREGSGRYGLLETRELGFARQEDALRIDDTRLTAAAMPPPGTPLEGDWTGGAVTADVSVERRLTFARDGRFRRVVETRRFPGGSATAAAAGRYRVQDRRLLLWPEEGPPESLGLLQPDPGSDAVLFIGGDAYLKRAPPQDAPE